MPHVRDSALFHSRENLNDDSKPVSTTPRNVEPPDRSVPRPVVGALAAVGETAWRLLPLPGAPPVTRFAYWIASQECTIDISKARNELGYEPVRSVEEGLEELRAAAGAPS